MRHSLSTILFTLLCCITAHATKVNTPDVTGTIVDSEGQPIEFVNIALLDADSTYIQGATSNGEGKFHILTPETGGILRISCIGYETTYTNVRHISSGIITLREDAKMMGEVTVKGQKPKTKLTGNSMVTSIEGTVLGQSGTADEMLGKVPGMTRKGDDLEVLGKGTPVFYINGRKVQDKDELKRLRSEEIQDVEVITNPGAQYDATMTAVVRIKTIRRQGDGFGYDLMANNNQDLRHGHSDPNATVKLRYRHDNLDVFGLVNYWKWDNVNDTRIDQASYFISKGQPATISQNTRMLNRWYGQGMNYNLGFNWQINKNHSLGMRVERHDKIRQGTKACIDTDLDSRLDGVLIEKVENQTHQDDKASEPYNWEGNAYYNGQVGKLNIDLNVDFVTHKQNEENAITELDKSGAVSLLGQEQHTSTKMWADKLVLSYPIWKGQLEAGTEMSFVTRRSTYTISGYPLPSTNSEVTEKNIAGFLQYNFSTPQIGNISAGLRYEHVGFDYTDNINASKSKSRYTNDFFPSLSWSRQFGAFQASAAYSFRTVRPYYSQLDEGILYINKYSLQQGDPQLKNATMQEVSINARWKWLTLFMAYERRDRTQTQWSYLYNDEGVVLLKNINLEKPIRNLATFLTANPTWGVYSANWTAGVQKYFNKMTLLDPREANGEREVEFNKPIMFFDLNNAFRFKHSWQLEANMSIQTKGNVMNYYMSSASYRLGFVVQKCWLKNDALCVRATIDDVLQRSSQTINMDCGYFTIHQPNKPSNHRLNISVRYTFNASNNKYKGTGAGKSAAERMSN